MSVCHSGELTDADNGNYGASAHSDYGMITLLATDGVPGLQACLIKHITSPIIKLLHPQGTHAYYFGIAQICKEKDREPQLWEDVHHVNGYAF